MEQQMGYYFVCFSLDDRTTYTAWESYTQLEKYSDTKKEVTYPLQYTTIQEVEAAINTGLYIYHDLKWLDRKSFKARIRGVQNLSRLKSGSGYDLEITVVRISCLKTYFPCTCS